MKGSSLKSRAPPLLPAGQAAGRASATSTPPRGSSPVGSPRAVSLKDKAPPVSHTRSPQPASTAAPPRASSPVRSPRASSPRHSPRPGSPRPGSPRGGSPSPGPLRSPKPAILHTQQRSVGAADLENTPFASLALTPQTLQRTQVLALDAGHARVHLSPRGQAEDRGAQADRDLRRLLGINRLHQTGSSPGRSASPGSARVRDTLARQRLVRESESVAKLSARQQSLRQEYALDQPVRISPRRDASNFTSVLAEARARTSLAVTGTVWASFGSEPEPEPELQSESKLQKQADDGENALRLYPDTVVSQWGAYLGKLQQQPTALQLVAASPNVPRVEDAAKAEILRAQKARLKGRSAPRDTEEPSEPVVLDPVPEPEPERPRSKPVLCVQGGVHTHGPDGCALCNSVREAALNGTLVVPRDRTSPGKWLSSGSPTPAQLGYKEADPKVPQLVNPSSAVAYHSPLRRGESLRGGHSIPSLLSPVAGASSGLFDSPVVGPDAAASCGVALGGSGYTSPLRKSTWIRQRGASPS